MNQSPNTEPNSPHIKTIDSSEEMGRRERRNNLPNKISELEKLLDTKSPEKRGNIIEKVGMIRDKFQSKLNNLFLASTGVAAATSFLGTGVVANSLSNNNLSSQEFSGAWTNTINSVMTTDLASLDYSSPLNLLRGALTLAIISPIVTGLASGGYKIMRDSLDNKTAAKAQ